MTELPQYVNDLVNKIALAQGLTEISVEVKPGSNKGDNIMSDLCSAVVTGTRDGIAGTQLHLLCKLAPLTAARRKEFGSVMLFERESLMYNKIFPMFAEFQREKGLSLNESFAAYPKCYEAICDEDKEQFVIIMEDLRPQGFSMWPKSQGTPVKHARLVMEQLGKLHAVSFALKDQRPELYAQLRQLIDIPTQFFKNESMSVVMRAANDRIIEALDSEEHIRIVQDMSEHIKQYYEDVLIDGVWEPFGVVGHGDCWSNNLIYRYKNGVRTNKGSSHDKPTDTSDFLSYFSPFRRRQKWTRFALWIGR